MGEALDRPMQDELNAVIVQMKADVKKYLIIAKYFEF